MFGIMRPKQQCAPQQNTTYLLHRQHYCGTCKAIGNSFDQKSRLMLNFDTVFLSELLSELEQRSPTTWEATLQKVNTCFSMPKEEPLPFSLEYAAHASALLGALKVDDNIKDSGGFGWRIVRQTYRKTFRKASQKLHTWGLDTVAIDKQIELQVDLEAQAAVISTGLIEHLVHYAAPTAQITAQLFALGGQRLPTPVDLERLGSTFGQLMYILDAFEDYEKDVFRGEFNPLAVYWSKNRSLTERQLKEVRTILLVLEQQITGLLYALPISELAQERFAGRLSSNLALRIYKDRQIPKTWREHLALRWQEAKATADRFTCQPTTWVRQMNFYLIAIAVFINPEAQNYLPQEGKWEVLKWGVVVTATLASLGIVPIVRRRLKSRKERRQERRAKRKEKRFFKRFWNRLRGQPDTQINSGDCCSNCGQACCDGCCESCVDNNCCGNCCEEACKDDTCLLIMLACLALVVVVAAVIIILWATGVL